MKIYFLLLTISFCSFIHAQNIQGVVQVDGNQALPFATVQLSQKDGQVKKIETTNTEGLFKIKGVSPGFYFINISFIGYNNHLDSVQLDQSDIDLGSISLTQQTTDLESVTIIEEKPIVQVDPDKTIFNVSKDVTATGDNVIELLRKAPGLQIDNNDNIILEGKTGVLVYVDGKQSYLQGDDLSSYLKSLQAEEIESIEIITQPSAKYDAAGSAGILNIILKKEKGLGTKGSIASTLTLGDFGRNSTTLLINSRSKKMNVFGAYTNYIGRNTRFLDLYRIQSGNIFDAKTNSIYEKNNNQLRLGGDYTLNKKNTIGLALSYSRNDNKNESNSITPIINGLTNVSDSILTAPVRVKSEVSNLIANVNYTYEDTSGHRLTFDVDYVEYNRDRENFQPNVYRDLEGNILSENSGFQETPINIDVYSIKLDYEQNFWIGKLGFGTKFSSVNTNNVFEFYNLIGDLQTLNVNRSNTFDYSENISAAYINYNFQKKKWKFQFGLRMEHTISEGELFSLVADQNKTVKRDYVNLFPSGGVTYQANPNNSFALIYSRRIQRPDYQSLNPFEYQLDELNFRKGNPFLQPQFTENIKISNTYKYTLNTSLSYSYVSDYFAQINETMGDNIKFINTRNIADQQVWNFSVSYPFKVNKWWNVYSNASAYNSSFSANNDDFNPLTKASVSLYAQNTFTLPKKYKAVVSGWYSSPSIWGGTYEMKSMGSLNLAFQKDWGKWSAKISFNDILYTSPWRGETLYANLFIDGTGGGDSRNVRFFLRYSFGHSDVSGERKRKSGSESETNRISAE